MRRVPEAHQWATRSFDLGLACTVSRIKHSSLYPTLSDHAELMCRLWEDNFAEHLVWQRELAVAFLAGVWTYNTGWKDQEGLGEQAGGLRAPV